MGKMRFWTKFNHQFISYFFPSSQILVGPEPLILWLKRLAMVDPTVVFIILLVPYIPTWFTAKTARLNGSRNDKPPSRLRVHEVHLASKISIAIWWLCWLGRTTFSSSHQIHRSVLMQCGLDSWLQPVTCFCFCWTLEIKDCPGLFWQRESHIYIIYSIGELPQVEIPQPVFFGARSPRHLFCKKCLQS